MSRPSQATQASSSSHNSHDAKRGSAGEHQGAVMMKEWQTKTLAEVCEIKPPKAEARRRLSDTDLVSFLPMENLGIDKKTVEPIQTKTLAEVAGSYTYFADGDVLLAKITPCFENGKLGIAANLTNGIGFGSSEYIVFRPAKSVDKEWLYYYLSREAFRVEGVARMSGAVGHKRVAKEFIEGYPIPVPTHSEQQRIVGILDEAFDGIATAKANAEKNLHNARALFESYLQAVFTQRGEGWVDRQLASLCHEITVGHVGPMKMQYKESGVPFLRSQNIRPFEVSMENAMFIDEAFHRALKKSQLRPGDLAIVRTGYPGTAAVIPPELPDSNCSDLVIVRPSKEVNPHFLAAFFNSDFGKQLVLGKLVGAAQKHFNVTAAKEVMLHVPPMPEQRVIIAMIDSLREETQRLESIYQQKLAALDELKKSLLHQAFSGQL
jgi:type I restriction enzyme, S subunit